MQIFINHNVVIFMGTEFVLIPLCKYLRYQVDTHAYVHVTEFYECPSLTTCHQVPWKNKHSSIPSNGFNKQVSKFQSVDDGTKSSYTDYRVFI